MITGVFDDGRSDIPIGIVGPVGRVVVIDAGISGLTVANALMHAGVKCVVLEARDRIGGRMSGHRPSLSQFTGSHHRR